ncbi:hypothetical protein PQG02_14355 [Nostoc sp. UHCC 0926]|uniref:hypothetical protein n=1 Tax=unclassified Nostoc TaxID=2593658 RepID=UPI00236080C8|nr:hypothetical protein [Nostoc sp. UHCC 0926]WDD35422.1 hypothetical protein PQG02_14355 [Nostoc sp. UHCC 0926]
MKPVLRKGKLTTWKDDKGFGFSLGKDWWVYFWAVFLEDSRDPLQNKLLSRDSLTACPFLYLLLKLRREVHRNKHKGASHPN